MPGLGSHCLHAASKRCRRWAKDDSTPNHFFRIGISKRRRYIFLFANLWLTLTWYLVQLQHGQEMSFTQCEEGEPPSGSPWEWVQQEKLQERQSFVRFPAQYPRFVFLNVFWDASKMICQILTTSISFTNHTLHRYLPLNPNVDNLDSWIIHSPMEITLLCLMFQSVCLIWNSLFPLNFILLFTFSAGATCISSPQH